MQQNARQGFKRKTSQNTFKIPVFNASMLPPRQIPEKTMGNFSQSDNRFCSESRGRQCTCNAVMVLLFSKVTDIQYTPYMLDEILIRVDNHYKSVIRELKSPQKSYLLEISELAPVVLLYSVSYTIDKLNIYVGTIIREQHSSLFTLSRHLLL